jgi:hypothetical protein
MGDDATACTTCAQKAAQALRRVAEWLADDLVVATSRQTALGGSRGGGKPTKASEVPLPLDLRASEALAVLRSTLVGWVRVIAEDHTGSHPADTVKAMAAWLAPVIGWARGAEYGAELIDEILAAVAQAVKAVDRPQALTYAGRCQTCDAPIYALGGRQTAHCRTEGCDGEVIGVTAARLELLRRSNNKLVTAEQASRALTTAGRPVTARWIRQLAATGRLVGIPAVKGPSRYLLGDILDVLLPAKEATAS